MSRGAEMKIRTVTLGIRSFEDTLSDTKQVMESLASGKKVKQQKPAIYFESLSIMRKILTDERIRILKVVKKNKPKSIYELAKALGRDNKNVNDDVRYLAEMGLLDLAKISSGRETVTPSVSYDKIYLEIFI